MSLPCLLRNEGLFLATPLGPIRLPVDERIEVWTTAEGALRARHATRVLGLRCFTLAYAIEPVGDGA